MTRGGAVYFNMSEGQRSRSQGVKNNLTAMIPLMGKERQLYIWAKKDNSIISVKRFFILSFFLTFFQSRYLRCSLFESFQTLLAHRHKEVKELYIFSGPYGKGQGHKEIKLDKIKGSITLLFSVRFTSNFAKTWPFRTRRAIFISRYVGLGPE